MMANPASRSLLATIALRFTGLRVYGAVRRPASSHAVHAARVITSVAEDHAYRALTVHLLLSQLTDCPALSSYTSDLAVLIVAPYLPFALSNFLWQCSTRSYSLSISFLGLLEIVSLTIAETDLGSLMPRRCLRVYQPLHNILNHPFDPGRATIPGDVGHALCRCFVVLLLNRF